MLQPPIQKHVYTHKWALIMQKTIFFIGNGYIPTSSLKEILRELDDKLTNEELDGIVGEIDEDGSGTVDFNEFIEMMTGKWWPASYLNDKCNFTCL